MEAMVFVLIGIGLTLGAAALLPRLAGFLAQRPEDFATLSPTFDIRERLNGPMRCEGVIYGPTGKVTSRFVADMHAEWDGGVGCMTEDFRYDDGTEQHRAWQLAVSPDGTIRATAADIEGTGIGRQAGAGVLLKYRFRLPDSSGGHVLDATDWMYLMENGTIMNHSQFRKFGFKVAELVATMRPVVSEETAKLAAE